MLAQQRGQVWPALGRVHEWAHRAEQIGRDDLARFWRSVAAWLSFRLG